MRILKGHNYGLGGHILGGHGLGGDTGDAIAALFSGANAGVGFYYPTETVANLFQDTSRTVPVTTSGDDVAGVTDESGADNHASQGTAAAVPTWDATNKGIAFDGTDDVLIVSGLTGLTSTMTLAGGIISSDTNFDLFGNTSPFIQASSATTTALGYGGSLWIDGVKIYNASEADALAMADGSSHIFEVRGCDPSGETTLSIAESNFAGTLISPYLTRNTTTSALDAARAKLASDNGITLRNSETLTDQVATGGVYAPSDDTNYMWQDSTGQTVTDADGDPVGLVINPSEGVTVDDSRTLSGLGSELVTNGGFDADSDWTKPAGGTISGGAAVFTSVASTQAFNQLAFVNTGWHLIEYDVTEYTAGAVSLQGSGGSTADIQRSAVGSYSEIINVSNLAASLSLKARGTTTLKVDNVSAKEILGAHIYQSTAAARPTWDETSGLFDFDGTDDHFIADLSGMSSRTSVYAWGIVDTTDTDFGIFASSDGTAYVGYAKDADASATIAANAGTPVYYVNGTLTTFASRDAVHTALATGSKVFFEALFDASNAAWATTHIGRFGSVYLNGLAGDFGIIEDPGVIGRNIIRRDILAKHPSITFAGA